MLTTIIQKNIITFNNDRRRFGADPPDPLPRGAFAPG
jgi:hypothetical protein